MNEQQPDVQWAFPPEKPKRGRAWLIVLLVVAALIVAAGVAFFLIPRGDAPAPGASNSPSPSASASAKPTASPQPTATASVTPTDGPSTPPTVAPDPVDPDVDTFRTIVGPRLDDALTGLSMVGGMAGQEAISVIDQLQQDAQRLSDSVAPSSIDAEWRAGIAAYEASLTSLRTSAAADEDLAAGVTNSTNEVNALRSIVGM